MKTSRRRLTHLLLLVLLLATAACQRTGWPVAAGGGFVAEPTPSRIEMTGPIGMPVAIQLTAQEPTSLPRPQSRTLILRHGPLRQVFTPGGSAGTRTISMPVAASHRRLRPLHRAPADKDVNLKTVLLCAGCALLAATGLWLIIGVSGGAAVLGGVVLIGLAIFMAAAIVAVLSYSKMGRR